MRGPPPRRAAPRRGTRAARARAGGALGCLLYFQGRLEEGRDLLLSHQPGVDALGDPRLAGDHYFWLAHIAAHIGDSASVERFAARAIEEAERAGDETTIGKVRYVLSREGFYTGRYAEGLEQARTAVATLEATEEWWWLGHALG